MTVMSTGCSVTGTLSITGKLLAANVISGTVNVGTATIQTSIGNFSGQ